MEKNLVIKVAKRFASFVVIILLTAYLLEAFDSGFIRANKETLEWLTVEDFWATLGVGLIATMLLEFFKGLGSLIKEDIKKTTDKIQIYLSSQKEERA